jgi:hypothetical protein
VVTEEAVGADLALGRHTEIVGELGALVAEHPYQERLRPALMLALYRSGRRADALGCLGMPVAMVRGARPGPRPVPAGTGTGDAAGTIPHSRSAPGRRLEPTVTDGETVGEPRPRVHRPPAAPLGAVRGRWRSASRC